MHPVGPTRHRIVRTLTLLSFGITIVVPGRAVSAVSAGGYVDSKLCASCHAALYQSYRQTGMGKSFFHPTPETTVEDYKQRNDYHHEASDTHYQMLQRDGKYFQRRYQIGYDGKETNVDEKQIDFVMGSGNHARTYLHRTSRGTLVELPLAWYSEKGGYWAMNPGYDTLYNPGARRNIGYECMFCHNAYPKIPPGQDRLGAEPVYAGALPEGIDCQRCHGPGQRHIEAAQVAGARLESIRLAIVNPSRLAPERQMEVCMQCHLEPTSFRLPHAIKRYERSFFSYNPGEPLSSFMLFFDEAPGGERDDRFEIASSAYRLRKSQCFLKSNGALKCTTCHNPHKIEHRGEMGSQSYNAACRQCHRAGFDKLVAAGKHTVASGCVDCHMPKRRTEDVVHVVMTDHYIQRTKPDKDLLAARPERQETDSNAYHGPVMPYYPNPLRGTAEDALYLAIAQIRDKSNLNDGIPQLTQIIKATRPRRAEPWFELAEALRNANQWSEAIPVYQSSLRRNPGYLPALLDLGATLKSAGQQVSAAAVFKRAAQAAPADARPWNELGQIDIDLGRKDEAIQALEKAASLDPDMPEPHNGLGILRVQAGDLTGAESAFREAIRMLPNYGEARGNLANVLSSRQNVAEAAYEFEWAIRLVPNNAVARYNYGSMLNGMRRFDEAQPQLEAALAADPNLAEAHDLLGNLFERKGQTDEALREYLAAVRLRPELNHAQLDLGAVLARKGDVSAAAEHLKLAATSSDPMLRRFALQLLDELAHPK